MHHFGALRTIRHAKPSQSRFYRTSPHQQRVVLRRGEAWWHAPAPSHDQSVGRFAPRAKWVRFVAKFSAVPPRNLFFMFGWLPVRRHVIVFTRAMR